MPICPARNDFASQRNGGTILNTKVSQIQQRLRTSKDQGFTLVELLIVIVVLGILSGIVLFGVARFRTDATAAACKADVATVSVAADAYDAQTGNYPTDVASLVTGGYLKSTPSGTYAFNATTKTPTRTPAC
jgi:prepilin-type N-terminal cleavage/methylation domain-containing protein